MKLSKLNKKVKLDVILGYLETGFIIARLTDNRHALISVKNYAAPVVISTSPLSFIRGHEKVENIPKEYIEKAVEHYNHPNCRVTEFKSEPVYPPEKDLDGNYIGVFKEYWEYYDTLPQIKVK